MGHTDIDHRSDRRHSSSMKAVDASVRLAKGIVILAGAGAILMGAASALGFRSASPGATIAHVTRQVDSNTTRITNLEKRADSMSTRQNFTNYLLCVQMRTTNPVMLPPDCTPIILNRGRTP